MLQTVVRAVGYGRFPLMLQPLYKLGLEMALSNSPPWRGRQAKPDGVVAVVELNKREPPKTVASG